MGKLAHKCWGQMEEEKGGEACKRERICQREDRKRKMDKNRCTDRDGHTEVRSWIGWWSDRQIDRETSKQEEMVLERVFFLFLMREKKYVEKVCSLHGPIYMSKPAYLSPKCLWLLPPAFCPAWQTLWIAHHGPTDPAGPNPPPPPLSHLEILYSKGARSSALLMPLCRLLLQSGNSIRTVDCRFTE